MWNPEIIRYRIRKFLQRRQNDLLYLLSLMGLALCRLLPSSVGIRLGGFLGDVAFYILPRERNRALEHISIAFPTDKNLSEKREIAKSCFRNLGKNAVEFVNFHRIKKDLDRNITLEGKKHLDDALAQGKGVIWLTAHLGNWELLGSYIAQKGYPLSVVARKANDKRLNRLLVNMRKRESVDVILRESPSAGRQILQTLKNRGILAMLIDQDTKVKGVMADFFGRKANTPAGPAILARRKTVPVLPGFILREPNRKHRIVICPPVEIVRTEDKDRDLEVNTERFNKVIEQYIRAYPEQWVWMHRRWRRETAYQPAEE